MTAVAIMRLPDRFHVECNYGKGTWNWINSYHTAHEAFERIADEKRWGSKLEWRVVHSQSRVLESEDDA